MYKPVLSIMMPAIRTNLWTGLYNSIWNSIQDIPFEIIFVGPHSELPDELKDKANVKLIKDYGSPTKAFGIALEFVEGEYVTWAADDATYNPGTLKEVMNIIIKKNNPNLVIAMEQTESSRYYSADSCRINADAGIRCSVPDNFYFFPTALMKTSLYKQLGGLDCKYETHAMAHLDFAIRAQFHGVDVEFYRKPVLHLTHMMGRSGDHGPIADTQEQKDQPLFLSLYRDPKYTPAIYLDLDDWRKADIVWDPRFKVSTSSLSPSKEEQDAKA